MPSPSTARSTSSSVTPERRFPGRLTQCAKCGVERKHYRIKGRTASVADHAAVRDAIVRRHADGARVAMQRIITDVLDLIEGAEVPKKRRR